MWAEPAGLEGAGTTPGRIKRLVVGGVLPVESRTPGATLVTPEPRLTPRALLSLVVWLMVSVLRPSVAMEALLARVIGLGQVLLAMKFSRAPALLKPGPLSVRNS